MPNAWLAPTDTDTQDAVAPGVYTAMGLEKLPVLPIPNIVYSPYPQVYSKLPEVIAEACEAWLPVATNVQLVAAGPLTIVGKLTEVTELVPSSPATPAPHVYRIPLVNVPML